MFWRGELTGSLKPWDLSAERDAEAFQRFGLPLKSTGYVPGERGLERYNFLSRSPVPDVSYYRRVPKGDGGRVFFTHGMGNGHHLPSGSETLDTGIIWSLPKLFSCLIPTGLMKGLNEYIMKRGRREEHLV